MTENKVSDVLCENLVLGTLINTKSAYNEVASFLSRECFTEKRNEEVYLAIKELSDAGDDANLISISAKLSSKGSKYTIADVVELSKNNSFFELTQLAMRLRELAMRRKLWEVGQRLVNAGLSETDDLDSVYGMMTDSVNTIFSEANGVCTLKDAVSSLAEMIYTNIKNDTGITGTPTGFSMIDKKGGLHNGDLVIVAGESSQGKTSLALTMTRNAAAGGKKIAWYSMEMTKEQLTARWVSSISGVPADKILYGNNFSDSELQAIDDSFGKMPGENIFFDDNSTSVLDSILMSIRSMKLKFDIDGAAIDYLQILGINMTGKSSFTKEQMMGDAARRLKNLAKELNIWIMALSQLNRNSQNPEPTLNRLRDSGQIGEAADIVILIYRPEYYGLSYSDELISYDTHGTAMINVAKGRNIGTFRFIVNFDKDTTTFTEQQNEELAPIEESDIDDREYSAPF